MSGLDRKVVVLGLDGATFNLIKPWVKEGKLPTFKRVMEEGTSRILESTIPPISATAWATFLTGKNPGKHGIFEFRDVNPASYTYLTERLVNSDFFSGSTFLDYAASQNLKVCSFFVPITYPPWDINGIMIAGGPNPDNSKSYTYPPDLDFGVMTPYPGRKDLSIKEIRHHIEYETKKRIEILCSAIKSSNYNLMAAVLQISDVALHAFWRFMDPDCPTYDKQEGYDNYMLECYQIIDEQLAEVLSCIDEDTALIIMSDHGGCQRSRNQFHINSWLKEKGYFKTKRAVSNGFNKLLVGAYKRLKPFLPRRRVMGALEKRKSLTQKYLSMKYNVDGIDWLKTKAYNVTLTSPTTGIEINLKGRQANGAVELEKYEQIRDTLIEELKEIKDPNTGENIIRNVYKREELYSGDYLSKAPDLVLLLDSDYEANVSLNSSIFTKTPHSHFIKRSGYHNLDGIFIAKGNMFKRNNFLPKSQLIDLPATILYSLGLPIPEEMDAKVLTDIFTPSFLESNKIKYNSTFKSLDRQGEHVLTFEEEEKMKEHLRSLGYLD